MKLRWITTFIVLLACLITLTIMFKSADPVPRMKPGSADETKPLPPGHPQQNPADREEARRTLEEAPPVELNFDGQPLPSVIDELVRQTGIQVIADFAPDQDNTMVTMAMSAPPFMVLETVADQYGMELLQTDGGWWLRPLGKTQRVCYRIHDLGGDAEAPRVERLVENLRKIVSDQDSAISAEGDPAQVTADADGLHISASHEAHKLAAAYLEVAFHRAIEARREDVPASP